MSLYFFLLVSLCVYAEVATFPSNVNTNKIASDGSGEGSSSIEQDDQAVTEYQENIAELSSTTSSSLDKQEQKKMDTEKEELSFHPKVMMISSSFIPFPYFDLSMGPPPPSQMYPYRPSCSCSQMPRFNPFYGPGPMFMHRPACPYMSSYRSPVQYISPPFPFIPSMAVSTESDDKVPTKIE